MTVDRDRRAALDFARKNADNWTSDDIDNLAALAAHLDAAERRGEERVLRWLTKHRLPLGVKMYTEARRARGGKR